jgi:hypothetical protein
MHLNPLNLLLILLPMLMEATPMSKSNNAIVQLCKAAKQYAAACATEAKTANDVQKYLEVSQRIYIA